MIFWLTQQGWRLLQYPAEILLNAVILWLLLNRLSPPRMIFLDPPEPGGRPSMRLERFFPFPQCLGCSLALFVIAYVAAIPLLLGQTVGLMFIPGPLLFLLLWFFGSRWAVSTFFDGSSGHHWVIFFLYLAVSFGVEWAIRKFV